MNNHGLVPACSHLLTLESEMRTGAVTMDGLHTVDHISSAADATQSSRCLLSLQFAQESLQSIKIFLWSSMRQKILLRGGRCCRPGMSRPGSAGSRCPLPNGRRSWTSWIASSSRLLPLSPSWKVCIQCLYQNLPSSFPAVIAWLSTSECQQTTCLSSTVISSVRDLQCASDQDVL